MVESEVRPAGGDAEDDEGHVEHVTADGGCDEGCDDKSERGEPLRERGGGEGGNGG